MSLKSALKVFDKCLLLSDDQRRAAPPGLVELKQVATIGYSKVLTDSALQVDFFIHLPFFLKNAKIKVLTRPKPSVNMQRIHYGSADAVNTSEIMNCR